jgi:CRP-like cAMP-binding protein
MQLLKQEIASGSKGVESLLANFCGKEALQTLTQSGNTNHYRKKQVIYTEGNYPVRLFYIEKGKVKIYKTNDDGKELTVGLFAEGDFLGYTALLEEAAYGETAEAIEDTEITVIAKDDFEKLMHNNSEVQHKFIKLLAQNVSEKEEQLLAIAYNSLRKRVADALITLQQKYKKENEAVFSMHISREDLAKIAGTATESLIRTLSDFKAEKLIEIKGGNITLLNQKKLASLAN